MKIRQFTKVISVSMLASLCLVSVNGLAGDENCDFKFQIGSYQSNGGASP